MKIEMVNFETKFNLHCPRCGFDDWSEEEYNSGANTYHKCMHCGADVCTDKYTKIGIVIEEVFYEFTPNTYDLIKKCASETDAGWKIVSEVHRGTQH